MKRYTAPNRVFVVYEQGSFERLKELLEVVPLKMVEHFPDVNTAIIRVVPADATRGVMRAIEQDWWPVVRKVYQLELLTR